MTADRTTGPPDRDAPPPDPSGPAEPTPTQRIARMRSLCRKALQRAERTLTKQRDESVEAAKAAWYRQIADSIMTDLPSYPRGTSATLITNIHTQAVEEVKLNPKLAGAENAELLYKKARRSDRGAAVITQQIAETEGKIARLQALLLDAESLSTDLESPDSTSRVETYLSQATSFLQDLGVLPRTSEAPAGTPREERVPYYHFVIDGHDVYAGRTATQNDELTTRFARPWDVWLHVAAHAGSHVVIRRDKSAPWPPQTVIAKAAALAVWFSKAKHTSYAEVHVTEGRFVRKRRKSPPGEVIAERCKTVRVAPRSPQELFSAGESLGS